MNKPILLLVVIGVLVSGCANTEEAKDYETINDNNYIPVSPRFDVSVFLLASKAPALGETTELIYTMTTMGNNISNFSGKILLPDGLEYISGDLKWEGDFVPNQIVEFKAVVKAVKVGEWAVFAQPEMGKGDSIYLAISENSGEMQIDPTPGKLYSFREEQDE